MSGTRDKELDKRRTLELIRNPNRPKDTDGENWLGHGALGGQYAKLDNLLLDGATMEEMQHAGNAKSTIRAHIQSLKRDHDLLVIKDAHGRWMFDRKHLEIAVSEPFPEEIAEPQGLPEGAVRTITVNAYERNREARDECIKVHGTTCTICAFNFRDAYGEVAEGRIHVHHLRPLSEIGEEYFVDPVADLRPVCPNCHLVLHLRNPAYSIEEVKAFLGQRVVRAVEAE